jgi:hypothetical protein
VKFEEDELAEEYVDTGREISDLKKEYIKNGGQDPEFLLNLMELEKQHKKAYSQVMDNAYLKEPMNREVLTERNRQLA